MKGRTGNGRVFFGIVTRNRTQACDALGYRCILG